MFTSGEHKIGAEVGEISTKATIVDPEIVMEHYLLGNRTYELIEAKKNQPHLINAVLTRNQRKKT